MKKLTIIFLSLALFFVAQGLTAEATSPIYSCSITSFTIDGSSSRTITSGDPVELAWTSTFGCNYVNISGIGSNLPRSGHLTIYPDSSDTYRATAYGFNGSISRGTVSVYVNFNTNYSCSILEFTANNSRSLTIRENRSVKIEWRTSNCANISISGVGNNLPSSGSRTIYPNRSARYTITANSWREGTQSKHIYITVKPNSNYYCVIEDFGVNDSRIEAGDRVQLSWETENCTPVRISNIGNVSNSGSRNLYPAYTTNYVLTAHGFDGRIRTRSVLVTVDPYNRIVVPTPIYNTCAVTTIATNITQNRAQLNGVTSNYSGGNTYFEYGPTVNLGYKTNSRYTTSNVNFSEIISGLSTNTIYFFRMVSDCQNGVARGSIEVFKTQGSQKIITNNSKITITQGPTVVNTESPITLKIENRYKAIEVDDIIDYTITYKNVGGSTLTNSMLQVVAPKGIVITNASDGTYSLDTNTQTIYLDDLAKGKEGVIYLRGQVESIPDNLAQVVTTAVLIYTNQKGIQENTIAYVLNTPKNLDGNSLAASAFGGRVSGISLISLLVVTILILLAVLIVRSFYLRTTPNYIQKNNK